MMNKRLLILLFSMVLSVLICFSFLYTIHAQGPSPLSPKETLTQAIQERAKADAEAGKQMEGVNGLAFLFGKEAEAAGMSNLYSTRSLNEAGCSYLWITVHNTSLPTLRYRNTLQPWP